LTGFWPITNPTHPVFDFDCVERGVAPEITIIKTSRSKVSVHTVSAAGIVRSVLIDVLLFEIIPL
jgi:hypothetical protein